MCSVSAGTSDGNGTIAVCFSFQFLPEKSSGCTTVSWCYWAQSENPPPPTFQSLGWGVGSASRVGVGVLRSLRLRSGAGGGRSSRWLLILQDEAPGPRRWERAPPLCGLAPLGGGGGSVSGPARWGSAVGWAGWSQEAGVQGRSHWRARQVLRQTHVRQPCFCSVGTLFLTIVSKKEGEKSHYCFASICYILQQQPQNTL